MKRPIERKYEIGLSFFEGIGPVRYALLTNLFGSSEAVFKASLSDLQKTGLSDRFISQFISFRDSSRLDEIAREIEKNNIHVLTQEDTEYPQLLAEVSHSPFILYAKGDVSLLHDTLPIGIVGTRKPTRYGAEVTQLFTKELVSAGCTIVSGMAMGVDAIAHETALSMNGRTIAVLGCGVNICYPAVNREIYHKLEKRGLIISEFPPDMRTSKGVFPSRNRIIAGLSKGVLVTEGTDKSGSLITAKYAAEYGREVYAIPGPITSELSQASLILLQNGAQAVGSPRELLSDYQDVSQKNTVKREQPSVSLTKEERDIVMVLCKNGSSHVDAIVRDVSLSSSRVLSIISRMELTGLVSEVEDNVYESRIAL